MRAFSEHATFSSMCRLPIPKPGAELVVFKLHIELALSCIDYDYVSGAQRRYRPPTAASGAT